MRKVIIVGGGLSGLILAIQLVKAGIQTILFEKKKYPFHRVCGEYISNETVPFLKSHGIYPEEFNPAQLQRLQITSCNGNAVELPLDMGGFGISRFTFDYFLYQNAILAGVIIHVDTEVEEIHFEENKFSVRTSKQTYEADLVVGSFGKRSRIDVSLERNFIRKRSPYVGVKYHIKTKHSHDLIALHNFKDGYCGMSNIEDEKTNLCYLTHRDNLKKHKSIPEMEEAILFKNPFLKNIFLNSEFIFKKPEVINEISFETKSPVENHILMTGDAAGMITPLCGNGMAMAIHSSKIATEEIVLFCKGDITRAQLEQRYTVKWKSLFAKRLWVGRKIQNLFGSERASDFAVNLARYARPVAGYLISKTHGTSF